jgi:hypothetical protein
VLAGSIHHGLVSKSGGPDLNKTPAVIHWSAQDQLSKESTKEVDGSDNLLEHHEAAALVHFHNAGRAGVVASGRVFVDAAASFAPSFRPSACGE